MDFLSSDIAVTLLAKVLEVNDSGQCHPKIIVQIILCCRNQD